MSLPCDLLFGMSCGFTGSRHGITAPQRAVLMSLLAEAKPLEAHYGDCTGGDYEFFMICRAVSGIWMVSHPGDRDEWRMFTLADELRDPKPPLDRNRDIVAESDYLIGCPREEQMILRSGTWATVRYARAAGRTVLLILPDGRVDVSRAALLGYCAVLEEFILSASVSPDGTVTVFKLLTHLGDACQGPPCVIHAPSDHHMRGWLLNWRDDVQLMERVCEHGIGHPDPDHVAWARAAGRDWGWVHGCDGCCRLSSGEARDLVMRNKVGYSYMVRERTEDD